MEAQGLASGNCCVKSLLHNVAAVYNPDLSWCFGCVGGRAIKDEEIALGGNGALSEIVISHVNPRLLTNDLV